MVKRFIDANVFLEIMFARSKMEPVSKLLHDKNSEFFTSVLTIHILYYFAELENIDRGFVQRLADLAKHLSVDAATVMLAHQRYDGRDFEDCLQAACAEAGGCDDILTLDKHFSRVSKTSLPVHVIN